MHGTHVQSDHSVLFLFHHGKARNVFLASDFTTWQWHPLQQGEGGWWYLHTPPLPPGDYAYKFVADGVWFFDQFNFRLTPDGRNSLIHVGTKHGHLLRRSFYSPALCKEKDYIIYLPPSYPYQQTWRYSTLYLLGGIFEDEKGWCRKGQLVETYETLREFGVIGDFLVVMPDKDDAGLNEWGWEHYYDYLAKDLIGHIDFEYRTIATARHRAIEGLSIGAMWALRIVLRFPRLFSSLGFLSGYCSDEMCCQLTKQAPLLREQELRLRVACGDSEMHVIDNNRKMVACCQELGLACQFDLNHGIHDWPLWIEELKVSLPFHWNNFQR